MVFFQPEAILDIVKALASDGTKASFLHDTGDRPFSGGQCLVYAVQLGSIACGVRIPVHYNHLPPSAVAECLALEVSVLRSLEERGFAWSPRVLGFDAGFDNPIKFPYVVLSWIDGKLLEWTPTIPQKRHVRDKVLRQMADIVFELVSCTEDAYMTEIIHGKMLRVCEGQLPGVLLHDCLVQQALVRKTVYEVPDDSSFALAHGDLAPESIIVDDEYNIKGFDY
ncbi:kinase-like domain protein [Phialemonium atrogriseum]|uniref:Kinase-like domain protein n=1 Tax=Phialemonium atrogriseum TaxID=1093897 RepID=A0AAJ0BYD2_9PEZI|nr:kinase-like domain protein [Phialemonium atrogriseum]KAK1766585.1 kinase-like domain protein [Phialemonium atrogriseum]